MISCAPFTFYTYLESALKIRIGNLTEQKNFLLQYFFIILATSVLKNAEILLLTRWKSLRTKKKSLLKLIVILVQYKR